MLLPLRFPKLWLIVGWALVTFALYVCLNSNGVPGTESLNDKFMHTTGYLGLTVWFTGIYPRARYLLIATLLMFMGIGVEILQNVMDVGRQADPRDVAANALGIGIGIVLALSLLGGWVQRVEAWIASRG